MNPADFITVRNKYGKYPRVKFINTGGLTTYVGIVCDPRGGDTDDEAWIVFKLTYDDNNNVTDIRTSPEYSIMDNYLTLTYS